MSDKIRPQMTIYVDQWDTLRAENERMRKFIEWVAETFKGRSLENDARAALKETSDD